MTRRLTVLGRQSRQGRPPEKRRPQFYAGGLEGKKKKRRITFRGKEKKRIIELGGRGVETHRVKEKKKVVWGAPEEGREGPVSKEEKM